MVALAQSLINHVAMVLDTSTSIEQYRLVKPLIQVADSQIQYLARRSTELDQETRSTVYKFADRTECLFYDKDVLRLPSIADVYRANGNTALIDATIKAIEDLKQTATLYGDHAFLVYVLTDGEENRSIHNRNDLFRVLAGLPDNWSVAALVPNKNGRTYAENCGFAPDNVAIWEVSADGVLAIGSKVQQATENFMQNRAVGIRGSKSIFKASTVNVDTSKLVEVHKNDYKIMFIGINEQRQIRDFVQEEVGSYKLGCAYYQLTKPVDVQARKKVAVLDTKAQKLYTGDAARQMVGIPLNQEVRVHPENHVDKMIFIQSTSVNRKLEPNTMLVIIK